MARSWTAVKVDKAQQDETRGRDVVTVQSVAVRATLAYVLKFRLAGATRKCPLK